MKYICGFIFLYAALFPAVVLGADDAAPTATRSREKPWPYEKVELEPSPRVTWGHLDNGLRYAIMSHASPPGRVSLRLLVNVGSLDENSRERGYAHFVEHMAFIGTKHFPTGELVKFLQRQGAAFGPHVNASTAAGSTIYKLELPDNSAATLADGLRVFRDYADGILFDPAEVQREKGVILSEKQFRENDEESEQLARTVLLYAGTLVPDRPPIGLVAQIEKADAKSLKRFYNIWYRPENMGIVIVGDVSTAQAENLIRTLFDSMSARAMARARTGLGSIEPLSEVRVATHATASKNFDISVVKVARCAPSPPTWGTLLKGLRLQSAFAMLARRLDRLSQTPDPAINNSSASVEVEYGQFRVLALRVSTGADDWENSLAMVEQEVRRVIEHGFGPDELALQKNILRTLVRNAARTIGTQPSGKIAETIADAMQGYGPFIFTGENLAIDLAMVDRLTAADCQHALSEGWGKSPPRIFIATDAADIPPVQKVREVYASSRRVAVSAAPPVAAALFAYEDFGPAGQIAEKAYVADLDLWLVRFSNGVRLNLKRTSFETGLVRLKMRIGAGNLSEPADKPGLRFWTGAWWDGGLGKHTVGELHLIGEGLGSITTGADEGALTLTSSARTESLPRALREMTALVIDPAFRADGHRATAAKLHSQLDPLWRSPEGPRQRFILPSLAGNGRKKEFPDPETIFARTLDEFRAWISPQLASGPLDLAVIGDFEIDAMIAEFAKTFGTLPARQIQLEPPAEPGVHVPQNSVETFYYGGSAERPSSLDIYWPVYDSLTGLTRRQLAMVAQVLSDRVRDEVRNKKGAAYSSHAAFFASTSYPGLAGIRCTIDVKPQDATHYCDIIRDIASVLAVQGITSDELARAKAQNSAGLQEARNDNLYWLNNILIEAQSRPERLSDLRSAESDIARTSIADLDALARRYLGPDRAFRYIIEPDARAPKQNRLAAQNPKQ